MTLGDEMPLLFDSSGTGGKELKPKIRVIQFTRIILIWIFGYIGLEVLIELIANAQAFVHIVRKISAVDKHGKGDIWFSAKGVL